MKKLYICLAALMTVLSVGAQTANQQEDVTSQYITNASFEADDIATLSPVQNSSDGLRGYTLAKPLGWIVSGTSVTTLLITKDCYTDNNFGLATTISDGDKAYYLRM